MAWVCIFKTPRTGYLDGLKGGVKLLILVVSNLYSKNEQPVSLNYKASFTVRKSGLLLFLTLTLVK